MSAHKTVAQVVVWHTCVQGSAHASTATRVISLGGVVALYRSKHYPARVRTSIHALGPLGVEVANRWMLGWPKRVKALIEAGKYLESLQAQETREREALSQPGNKHLAHHEIAELYGLTPEPPFASDLRIEEPAARHSGDGDWA